MISFVGPALFEFAFAEIFENPNVADRLLEKSGLFGDFSVELFQLGVFGLLLQSDFFLPDAEPGQ